MLPIVSLIVPVLNDRTAVAHLLDSLPVDPAREIVVVDGGRNSGEDEVYAERPDVRLVRTRAGRAYQMNAGAAASEGRWLLFLHADSVLPANWMTAVSNADADRMCIGGWFRFELDDTAWQARVIERLVAWRVALLALPYGDQGIFVRREAFVRLGGFREIAIMEDVEFVRRLIRSGPTLPSDQGLVTSARRWRRNGWFRRSAWNTCLVSLYLLGLPPQRLARWYGAPGRDGGPQYP